jgi:membrane-bound lytic murein transglycosylase D
MRPRLGWFFSLAIAHLSIAGEPASPSGFQTPAGPASPGGSAGSDTPSASDLYDTGKELFDTLAPPEIKQQYEFPSRDQFDAFMAKLQQTIDNGSLEELAAYEPQARIALAWLRTQPAFSNYAEWLASRIDEIDEARQITSERQVPPRPSPGAGRAPGASGRAPVQSDLVGIPYYHRWLQRLRGRPLPANASSLMPVLRSAFSQEGVPPELAWLAEAESSLQPTARSPAGAEGLFQLKPGTAHDLGLSTFLPDERTDPVKSAHAAARQLRALQEKFGSWPLALAAYNAGEGRVGRALHASHARDFAGVAGSLPPGTRMYVPEVCALIAVRTGIGPDRIPPPR